MPPTRRHASRRQHLDRPSPNHPPFPSRKERRNLSSTNHPPINPLKTKIRDLTRLLDHSDHLPPGVRIEKERALAGYKQDLETAEAEKKKSALIGRYHMIRFFERQKATRHLKKATKRLNASLPNTPEHASALQDVHIAEVDLNYTLYCPLNAKYEGIYPQQKDPLTGQAVQKDHGNGGEAEEAVKRRPAMWYVVENCMREGQGALESLREGKMTREMPMVGGGKKPPPPRNHAKGPGGGVMLDGGKAKPTVGERADDMMDDGQSDGGFFEE